MSKRLYPHNRVRYWYAYELDEICAMFSFKDKSLHIQTVRAWIKRGLRTMDKSRPILIYGNDLIEFLKKQNAIGKCKTEFDQMFCMKCKDARHVYQSKIIMELNENKLKAQGLCRTCKTKMNKGYKIDDNRRLRRIFLTVDVLELSDCANPTSKTHLCAQVIMPLNESSQLSLF
jgi:hypothetical protein